MTSETAPKNVLVKMDASLHLALRHYCVDHQLTLAEAIEVAVRQLVNLRGGNRGAHD